MLRRPYWRWRLWVVEVVVEYGVDAAFDFGLLGVCVSTVVVVCCWRSDVA